MRSLLRFTQPAAAPINREGKTGRSNTLAKDGQRSLVESGKILTLPHVRKTSLSLTLLEFSHALVLMLWVGSLAGFALVVIPSLPYSLPNRELAVQATLAILERSAFLGCGAGAFLLATTLMMHLLALRETRAVIAQMALILVMSLLAILSQVLLAPQVADLLRDLPAPLATLSSTDPYQLELGRLLGIGTGFLFLQIAAGAIVLLFAVRRWYRYVPERREPEPEPEPGTLF